MTASYTHASIDEFIKAADKVSSIIYQQLGFSCEETDSNKDSRDGETENSTQMDLPF